MGRTIETYLREMGIGEVQAFETMALFPLTWPSNGGPEYITLGEAVGKGTFSVTEVSEGGSVPELRVENKGDIAVLMLDGEELAGAKQNRIINTTILVGPKSSLTIPVSCTEQGRWSYVSRQFDTSGYQLARKMRVANLRAVHENLRASGKFHSNQIMIWEGVAKLSSEAKVPSRTGAMKDVYDAKASELGDYLKAFRLVEGQKGLLVFFDGRPVGFDFVSRGESFQFLFPKLVKSYAMEAMLASSEAQGHGRRRKGGKDTHADKAASKGPSADDARSFLAAAASCDEQKNKAVGLGSYFRFTGPRMVGSALLVDEAAVHMAFFGLDEAETAGGFVRMSSRRGFRIL